jgi:hypothetical protein
LNAPVAAGGEECLQPVEATTAAVMMATGVEKGVRYRRDDISRE